MLPLMQDFIAAAGAATSAVEKCSFSDSGGASAVRYGNAGSSNCAVGLDWEMNFDSTLVLLLLTVLV